MKKLKNRIFSAIGATLIDAGFWFLKKAGRVQEF